MFGLEMMLKQMLESFGITPEQIQSYAGDLKTFAESLARDMKEIRADQLRIMEKLGIPLRQGESNENNRGIGNGIGEGE